MSGLKNSVQSFNIRLHPAEEGISELGDISIEMISSEVQKKKTKNENE